MQTGQFRLATHHSNIGPLQSAVPPIQTSQRPIPTAVTNVAPLNPPKFLSPKVQPLPPRPKIAAPAEKSDAIQGYVPYYGKKEKKKEEGNQLKVQDLVGFGQFKAEPSLAINVRAAYF